jgi:hypothetical protein
MEWNPGSHRLARIGSFACPLSRRNAPLIATLTRWAGLPISRNCYTADVTWLTADIGQLVQGPDSVRDYINALHSTMMDAQTRKLVVGWTPPSVPG